VCVGDQKHFYMEPIFAYAIPDEEQGMKVILTVQWPNGKNQVLSTVLSTPYNMVNIVTKRLGGAFGGKCFMPALFGSLAGLASKKYGVPVRLFLDRNTDMRNVAGRAQMFGNYEVATEKSGKIRALKFDNMLSSGCAVGFGWFANMTVPNALSSAYFLPDMIATSKICFSHQPPQNVCRGPGDIQAAVYMESVIDHVAFVTGVPSHEVRRINLIEQDEKAIEAAKLTKLDGYTAKKMWNEMEEKWQYKTRKQEVDKFNKGSALRKKGICMVPMRYSVNIWKRSALVNLYPDGSVLVTHGAIDMGQGINIKVAQVVAYELGQLTGEPLDIDDIKFAATQSHVTPAATFTGGSTGSEGACEASRRACAELVKRMQPIYKDLTQKANEAKSKEKADKASTASDPIAPVTFKQVAAAADGANMHMSATGHWADAGEDKATYNCWGVACTEVELDALTGEVVILRADLAYDAAKSLNPAIDIGQAEGCFAFGIGFMLQEEVLIDDSTGELISNGTWEYKPPLAINIPKELNIELLKNNKAGRVLSSKASGEPPLCMTTSVLFAVKDAIAAARADAGNTEYFIVDTPLTVTKRLALLHPVRKHPKLSKPLVTA